ncbi:MAG: hypothetical protein V9F06_05135 [Thermomicrobiales bacterium]
MAKKNKAQEDREGQNKIRKAERKLAAALADVDKARARVARRESKLSGLLQKYGSADTSSIEPETDETADGNNNSDDAAGKLEAPGADHLPIELRPTAEDQAIEPS